MTDVLQSPTSPDGDGLVGAAVTLVAAWLEQARALETPTDRATMEQLGELVTDPEGVAFVMQFVDRVARPDDPAVAAQQLRSLVGSAQMPAFLSAIDRALLRAGAAVAPLAPKIVMGLAARRMRSIVGHLVAPAEHGRLKRHLQDQSAGGYLANVNLLGEAVLGEREAQRRLAELKALVELPEVDYVSVKITAVASQLNHWDHEGSLERVTERLAELVHLADRAEPATFINFDMEEFHDLHLTVEAFKAVLSDPARHHIDAGIVMQAYLPQTFDILRDLTGWANARHASGGSTIKIRLVKGANLAMEQVEAALHGWEQAPFGSKLESDAAYRRSIDWLLRPEHLTGVSVGVASHNLFDVAWAKLLAEHRGVFDRVQFEMLQGMAPAQTKAVNAQAVADGGTAALLYTPAVDDDDFDVAIGYLFRRLEENASTDNYLRHVFDLEPGSKTFDEQAAFFREGVALRHTLDAAPRRFQDRRSAPDPIDPLAMFENSAETDPSLPSNREWIQATLDRAPDGCAASITTDEAVIGDEFGIARSAQPDWAARTPSERRAILHRVALELESRRSELLSTMMHEADKTIAQGDVEVSEAVDFARYYGDRILDLAAADRATFTPFGVIAVIPPWNFPTAIPAGGVLAALAAGNAVIFKPAPQVPRCGEIVAEACWAAGVPREVLRFVRTGDDAAGRAVVVDADAVILTGSTETADLFRSWRPDLRLFAETSGKNALIITPSADVDQAVEHLVQSAFGHAGQKCSAASLAILVGDLADSERFRRQLVDAVESLSVGDAHDPGTDLAPLVDGGNDRIERAVDRLDPGESWLVEPRRLDDGLLTPGVRDNVRPGSWFHRTECFGPLLGLMAAPTLTDAIAIANRSEFGLTGGIHTLDPVEVEQWIEAIEIGNGYVNRPITGAIVQRQPFGGWKRSVVGPGAKAGGPNYLSQLGTWASNGQADDYDQVWAEHFDRGHDPSRLFCEANVFRYRPLSAVGVVFGATASARDRELVIRAAGLAGVELIEPIGTPDDADARLVWLRRLAAEGIVRARYVGLAAPIEERQFANDHGIHIADGAVTASGRVEIAKYLREQSMSITLHRFGNLVVADELRRAAGGGAELEPS